MVEMDNSRGRTLDEAMACQVCTALAKTIVDHISGGPPGFWHLEIGLGKPKPHPMTQFLGSKRWNLCSVRQRGMEPRTMHQNPG